MEVSGNDPESEEKYARVSTRRSSSEVLNVPNKR